MEGGVRVRALIANCSLLEKFGRIWLQSLKLLSAMGNLSMELVVGDEGKEGFAYLRL